MIRDGAGVASGEHLVTDVCVIGSGPAGLTVATELLGSGLRVLVVEAGRRVVPPGGDPYTAGTNVGLHYPLARSRAQGLGGTAHRWDLATPAGGPRVRLRELEELDFEDRPGVRTPGWPLSRAALLPGYVRARELFALPPADVDYDTPLGDGVTERRFSYGPADVFTRALPAGLAADGNTTVVCDAAITEIHLEPGGTRVTTLSGRTRHGAPFTVETRACVLAGGGIENARLLLASRSSSAAGIGNTSDQVGRWFMEHPHVPSGVVVPSRGAPLRRDAWDLFLQGRHPAQRFYGLSEAVQRREGLLDVAYYLVPRRAKAAVPLSRSGDRDAEVYSAVRRARRMLRERRPSPTAGRDIRALLRAAPVMASYSARQALALRAAERGRTPLLPIVFTLRGMVEQSPRADSRVRLGTGVDAFGAPEAELDWRVSLGDAASLHRTQELVGPVLSRVLGARVTSLLRPDELPGLGIPFHHIGTTRMAARPEAGVVDPDCRVHGVRNLFVAGSSVFPTGGSANPTLTIVALAVRLGAMLRRELPSGVAVSTPPST